MYLDSSFSICVFTCVTVNYVCSLVFLTISSIHCSSILSLSAVSPTCEFEAIDTITGTTNFEFPTTCLEAGDRLVMNFTSTVTSDFVTQLENYGEFTRDTATVTVVQGISVTRYIIAITTELVLL